MTATIDMGRVIQAHNAIRDARAAKKRAWEAEDAALETDQDTLRQLLLSELNRQGANSVATDYGTVYRTEKIKPSASDWAAVWEWAKENDGFEIVEKRLKVTFVKEYMDQNGGALPPGVSVHREYDVGVRRPNATAPSRSSA